MPEPMKNPIVVAELKALAERSGGILLPEAVVEAARSPASPLHPQFEWDDTVAAQRWRIEQARSLLRVVVQYLPGREKEGLVHVFVSLTSDRRDGGYRPLVDVMSNPEQRAQLLTDAAKELRIFRKKYGHLRELAAVFEAMDQVAGMR